MSVGFGSAGGLSQDTGGVVTSLTLSGFVPAAADTLIIGQYLAFGSTSVGAPSSATWAGSAMTLVGHAAATDGTTVVYTYAQVNPATGSGHTGVVNFTPSVGAPTTDWTMYTFNGTDTSSVANAIPSASVINDASTSSATHYTSSPFTITTVSGDAVTGACNEGSIGGGSTMAIGTLINFDVAANVNAIWGYNLANSSSTQLQFDTGGSAPYCGVVLRIVQPGGAAAVIDTAGNTIFRAQRPSWR